ncbi:MAG: WcbI family polysaccharide biosynthesis putative acetyltransferase [Naasia sp.]
MHTLTPSGSPDPRTRHFGVFYGLDEPAGDGPVTLVVGNCQAESLRIMLDAGDLRTVRLPAVHELTAADMPFLARWIERADILISQPVRDDYHALPVGTDQLASRLRSGGRVVRVPVIRFAGLYPAHAIIRPPRDAGMTPPLVEYHDLRLLVEAAGREPLPALDAERVRAIAELSLGELTRRERAHDALVLSDVFRSPSFELMRTLNHPGNPVWSVAASRVRQRLGLAEAPVDPGRPLLDSIHAPRERAVIEAWGLDDEPVEDWRVGGAVVTADQVRDAHLRWYHDNPDVVVAGLARHADTLRVLSA